MIPILDRWDLKLQNWALWAISGGRIAITNPFRTSRGWNEGPPRNAPALQGEAIDVDNLLHDLDRIDLAGRLQYHAIRIHYLWTGTEEMKARQAGIATRTLRDRVFIAKYRLDQLEQQAKLVVHSNNPMHKTREESITS